MISNRIYNFLNSLYLFFRNIGIISLVAVVVLLFLESILRKVMKVSIVTVSEIGGIGMYLYIVLNISWIYKIDGHIKSDFLVRLLPKKLYNILVLFLHIMTFGLACLVTYLWWRYLLYTTFVTGRFSGMTGMKEWPFHVFGVAGWGMLVIVAAERFVIDLRKIRNKES